MVELAVEMHVAIYYRFRSGKIPNVNSDTFLHWMESQGVTWVVRDRERRAVFNNDSDATAFLMKYG